MGADAYIEQQLHPENIPLPDALQQKLEQLSILSASPGAVLYQYQKALKDARNDSDESKKHRRELVGSIMEQTAAARLWRALESPRQLEEVMVDFWFNHFNVYEAKGFDRALVASYERDAIRPYVFGHFRDLLGATNPKDAAPGTIRADFADSIDANAVHGSDSLENAAIEIAYFFPATDVYAR